MKPIIGGFWAAVLLCGSLPLPATAQLGAIIDRIQKMSGPEMTYYGAFLRFGSPPAARLDRRESVGMTRNRQDRASGLVWRIAGFYGTDGRDDERGDGLEVTAWRAQVSVEYQIAFPVARGINLGLEPGVSAHRFGGDIDEDFWHVTYPVTLNLYPFAGCRGWLLRGLSAGAGVHFVPPFDEGEFAPITEYATEDWETPFAYHVALELPLSFLGSALGC